MRRVVLLLATALARAGAQVATPAPAPPVQDYYVFVASEGVDRIALVQFGPGGARVVRENRTGHTPTEIAGPHGVGVAPGGGYYFVSTAHGTPFGELWKYSTVGDTLKSVITLGSFPATVQVSPDGLYAWVVNFNLHGDMVPSSVSVVYVDDMVEIARIPTCTMPHGSRLSPDGSRHYSACMMDDMLVEINAKTMKVARHFMLGKGMEHGMDGPPEGGDHHMEVQCSPTWAQPTPDGKRVFVACNKSNDLVEIDVASWSVTRRIPTGNGTYNLAITHDGRLLIGTNKRGKSVSIIDAVSGKELALLPTTRRLPSGVTVSSDDRYAFVTVEGVGSEPGTVEVIDLRALKTVATVDVGQQAGGIDFWKMVAR
jgi:YVTN family beta-propeller protein